MQKISIEQAKADMVLGNDVTTADGKVLAPADSRLDDALLRRLKLAGTLKLVVRGKAVPGADMGYDALARAMRLEYLFRAHHNDKFMMALKSVLFNHFKERA